MVHFPSGVNTIRKIQGHNFKESFSNQWLHLAGYLLSKSKPKLLSTCRMPKRPASSRLEAIRGVAHFGRT